MLNMKTDPIYTIIQFAEQIMLLRDPYENGHEHRVADISTKLAIALDLTPELVLNIHIAARMHDIGKLLVAEVILNKVKITSSERRMIQSHSDFGAKIIHTLELDTHIEDIIRHHHENWNGTGYPDKLKGDEISIGARILRIADTFDAMTNERPYRKMATKKQTLIEMKSESGTSFEPRLFDKFEQMMKTIE